MKKFIITSLSIAFLAGYCSAQTNEVSSVNAVGYMKITIPVAPKLYMGGVNLMAVNGTDNIGLREYFGTNQLKRSPVNTVCDLVYLWDTVQQKYKFYGQKTDGYFYDKDNWGGSATNPILRNGIAYWVRSQGAETSKVVYVMGGVPTDGSVTNSITGSASRPLYFVANPYPTSILLDNLINFQDGAQASGVFTVADWIQIWDSTAQKYVFYGLRSVAGVSTNWTKWTGSAWELPASNVLLEAGQGVWYSTKKTTPITWIESKPYSWPN